MFEHPQTLAVTTTNVLYKLAGYSTVLLAIDYLFPRVFGPTFWLSLFPIFTSAIALTFIGAIADLTILPRMGNVPALLLGVCGMTLIVWFVSKFWLYTHVMWHTAFLTALCISPIEYALHRYVIGSLFPEL